MVFENYAIKDNAYWLLNSSINASTTTITLQTWNGANFPTIWTKKSVLTIVQYNTVGVPSSWILKFEKILCTLRSWDILTVQRGYDWTTATTFNSWDSVFLNITSKVIEDIQNELVVLDEIKQNNCVMSTKSANYTFTWSELNNTWFSTNTTSWNITYTLDLSLFPATNGMYEFTFCKSTNDVNIVIIDVWSWKTIDWNQTYSLINYMETVTIRIATNIFAKVIATSNRPVTLDINSLSEDTTWDIVNDFFIKNNWTWNNKKIKVSRYMATDLETTTWTNETKFINPKQAKDNYLLKTDTIQITRNTADASNTVEYNHWLWKIPKQINIESYFRNNNGTFNSSWTFANSKNQCTYLNYNWSAYSILSDTSNCVRVSWIWWWSETYGYINNLTTTTFSIVWTKVNASTGSLLLQVSLIG